MNKKEIIEQFLKKLKRKHKTSEDFYLVCAKCGNYDFLDEDGGETIIQDIDGCYTDYTGHLWDEITIKCKKCGNAVNFTR